jgi:ribosomal protein L12E/L44/L45/RPP1/RPP2
LKQLRPKETIFRLRGKTIKTHVAPAAEAAPDAAKTEAPAETKPAKGKGKKKAEKSDDNSNPALAS